MGLRPVEGLANILETGIVCPSCNTFYHAEYTTRRLISMYRDYRNEKIYTRRQHLLRAFQRANSKLQAEVELMLLKSKIDKALHDEQSVEQSVET